MLNNISGFFWGLLFVFTLLLLFLIKLKDRKMSAVIWSVLGSLKSITKVKTRLLTQLSPFTFVLPCSVCLPSPSMRILAAGESGYC